MLSPARRKKSGSRRWLAWSSGLNGYSPSGALRDAGMNTDHIRVQAETATDITVDVGVRVDEHGQGLVYGVMIAGMSEINRQLLQAEDILKATPEVEQRLLDTIPEVVARGDALRAHQSRFGSRWRDHSTGTAAAAARPRRTGAAADLLLDRHHVRDGGRGDGLGAVGRGVLPGRSVDQDGHAAASGST